MAKQQYLGLGDTKLTLNPDLLAYGSINPFEIQLLLVDNVSQGCMDTLHMEIVNT